MGARARQEEREPVVCLVCGYRFDPAERRACASCPLRKGCAFVCCPACGYGMVDVEHSRLVRLGSWIARLLRTNWLHTREATRAVTLADVPAGTRARIEALNDLPGSQHEQLQAYGVAPGRWLVVVQQTPLTVVRVDYTDLAFERSVARGIQVTLSANGAVAAGSGP